MYNCVYTLLLPYLLKFDSLVEAECIHNYTLIKFDSKTALSSRKAALRESNFKRHGRRRMYTHRKFDSQNDPFEPESSFTGIKFQEVVLVGMVPSVLPTRPTSSEPLQQQMFTDTEKNNDINISCAALALSCASQAKRTTNLQQHTPFIRLYKTPLGGFDRHSYIYIYI